ncbi:MAG: SDR family NAD(P)-dependent oxidoreductase [Alphaproteobacteria bacterium]
MRRFDGRTGILTGGAKGIGRAASLRFLAEGGRLAVIDKEPSAGDFAEALRRDAADNANRLCYIEAEATDEAAVAAAVETAANEVGPPDILVNNVGFGANPRPIEDIGLEEWRTFVDINLTSAFLMTRAVLPGMRTRGQGRIVNLASVAGRSISEMSALHYSTAKAAILGFTRKLAFEEGPNGITVNAVAPGTVFTERVETRFRGLPEAEQAQRMEEIPLRRAARPEEIAAAHLFLASDDASYVTGAALDVNGGRFMS